MKTRKLSACLLLIPVLLFTACVMTKTYTKEEKKWASKDKKVMIVKNNGDKVMGTKMTSSADKIDKDTYIYYHLLDGQKFLDTDMSGFQDKHGYYGKFGNEKDYMWVKQLKRGKINLYYYEYLGGENDVHFVFQKGNGKLIESNITEAAALLKDNPAAYAKFTHQFGSGDKKFLPKQLKNHPKVLFEAIDIYNG